MLRREQIKQIGMNKDKIGGYRAMKLKDTYSLEGVMTNLDSILKGRDITLPTKVRLVKAMVFPMVMYGCESWTVNKAEC